MHFILSFLAATAFSAAAAAQQPASDQDHAVHHPEGASAPATRVNKPSATPKAQAAKAKAPAAAASSGMGMGMDADMGKMHDEAHKPGGMHSQMHGKASKVMGGGAMSAMPAASAASK